MIISSKSVKKQDIETLSPVQSSIEEKENQQDFLIIPQK